MWDSNQTENEESNAPSTREPFSLRPPQADQTARITTTPTMPGYTEPSGFGARADSTPSMAPPPASVSAPEPVQPARTRSIPVAPRPPSVVAAPPPAFATRITPAPPAVSPVRAVPQMSGSSFGGTTASAATAPSQPEPAKRRFWPFLALAIFTIAASGLLSWVIVQSATDDQPSTAAVNASLVEEQPPAASTSGDAAAIPSVEPRNSAADALADEPFARAANIIAPSVVQLNVATGLGTGVIVNSNGTILTAAHVVGNSSTVEVRLFDGSTVQGTVAGTHPETDVAVVTIDPAGRDLVAAKIADGDEVRVGQLAVAVGSPFGFEQTVTAGIISGIDRVVNNVSMVQTDAPINPGNSGGPLINLEGEVVGINDLIFTQSGTSAGVGFAISIDLAVIVAEQIIAGEDVELALLGVTTTVSPNGSRGALVQAIVPGSAAELGGLEVGDLVIGIDGDSTRGSADLRAQIIDNAPGTTIVLEVLRNGEPVELQATLGSTG